MSTICIPRGAPLPDELAPLKPDRPEPGHWVLGKNWPLAIWLRCPTCLGQVPIAPSDVDEHGNVADAVHSEQNEEGLPLCTWKGPLRLLDYDRDEHQAAVEAANASVGGL